MQLSSILEGIRHAQSVQDADGEQHPGQTFAYTFPVTFAQRLLLQHIAGLEFVEQPDGVIGCFKPRRA